MYIPLLLKRCDIQALLEQGGANLLPRFIYLKLNGEPRCRLKYNGDINSLGFAIYKYSSEVYDPEEFFFPGMGHVNGTIEGAMKASVEAYPM